MSPIVLSSLFVALLLTTIGANHSNSSPQWHNNSNSSTNHLERNSRTFFSNLGFLRPTIFNIVQFPNEECLDASNQSGTCYTALECKKLGGNPSSKCARGLGTCCIMSRTCHNTTSNKVVYFKNPSFPLTDMGQNFCDLTVNIIDPDICQIRIDFLEFQIDSPLNGDCLGDKFTVTASGMTPTAVPILCGNNRNQHMYVTLPSNKDERSVSVVFETNSQGDYRWHLKVTQLDCRIRQASQQSNSLIPSVTQVNAREKRFIYQKIPHQITYPAPTGCLQYFTTSTGTIESFNFGQYLNNMDYAICIERQPDTCRIIYTATDANFGIDANVVNTMPGVGDEKCSSDYLLLVGGSQNGEGLTKDRYCGGVLSYSNNEFTSQPVVSKANGPIVIRFHSDQLPSTTLKEGFRVKYEQSPTDCLVLNAASNSQQSLQNNPGNIPQPVALESGNGNSIKIPFYQNVDSDQLMVSTTEAKNSQDTTIKTRFNGKKLIF